MTSEASWADALHKVVGERDALKVQLKEAQGKIEYWRSCTAKSEILKDIAVETYQKKLATFRSDALREAAEEAKKMLASYAVDQRSTKTTRGRSANFYGRKAQDAILALIKGPKT